MSSKLPLPPLLIGNQTCQLIENNTKVHLEYKIAHRQLNAQTKKIIQARVEC